MNFSVYGERTFNNLRTNFAVKIPEKEFFNSVGPARGGGAKRKGTCGGSSLEAPDAPFGSSLGGETCGKCLSEG